MSPLIALQDISKVYGSGITEVRALWEVSLIIEPGEYCAIMGPSGSGKSTAMNVIGCLDRPTAGQYFLDGQNVALLTDDELAHIRNRKIGVCVSAVSSIAPAHSPGKRQFAHGLCRGARRRTSGAVH
jgi:putative ABC transport system ATP-binding protein